MESSSLSYLFGDYNRDFPFIAMSCVRVADDDEFKSIIFLGCVKSEGEESDERFESSFVA